MPFGGALSIAVLTRCFSVFKINLSYRVFSPRFYFFIFLSVVWDCGERGFLFIGKSKFN